MVLIHYYGYYYFNKFNCAIKCQAAGKYVRNIHNAWSSAIYTQY